ncbi:MAG: TlpA family protein disulfide reductase [Nitrospirota bacterium]|nr:TlpA family protein disulfide reductase [Nitrospirota bacterium]
MQSQPKSLTKFLVPALLAITLACPMPSSGASLLAVDEALFTRAQILRVDTDRAAPSFELPDLQGTTVTLEDYRGKLVVLNFWATWCRPCIREMPALERLSRQLGPDGLIVLAISLDRDNKESVQAFVEGYGWKLPVLLDPFADVGDAYLVSAMPSTYVIGPEGTIYGRALGPREWDGEAALTLFRALLAPEPGAPDASSRLIESKDRS